MSDTSGKPDPKDEKITTGLNDRPHNATVGQTGGGLPDDSSEPVEISEEEEERRIAEKLLSK